MKNPAVYRIMLSSACLGCVLLFCGCKDNSSSSAENTPGQIVKLSVVKQLSLEHDTTLPVAIAGGFIIADRSGDIVHFDHSYNPLWRVSHKGMEFVSGGTVENGSLFIGSAEGSVLCVDIDDGSTLWTNALDATFIHPPLHGAIKEVNALWLLSADNGVVYCLNAKTGELLWQGEETTRSDGGMVLWDQRLVYGNCDGAAHIFDAVNGVKIASVPVGESDQMAGTPVVTKDGMLFIGTRQGHLAVVDVNRAILLSTLKISEQEAFAVPVLCADNSVVFGVQEGDVLLIGLKAGAPFVKRKYAVGSAVEHLLYNGEVLYALANGNLMVFDRDLKLEFSLNVGDNLEGMGVVGSGILAVKADRSLLFIKGELQ